MRVAGVERSRGYNGRRWGQSVQGFVDRGRTWASVLFFFFFWPCHVAYRILVPQPGIEPGQ